MLFFFEVLTCIISKFREIKTDSKHIVQNDKEIKRIIRHSLIEKYFKYDRRVFVLFFSNDNTKTIK